MFGLNIKLIAALVIAAAIAGALFYVRGLQNDVKELTEKNIVLTTAIETQNKAVETLKADADNRLKAAGEQLAVAKAEAAKGKGKATVIFKTKPSTPGNACKSALDLVNGVAK
jgi:uncharacterized protein HemX